MVRKTKKVISVRPATNQKVVTTTVTRKARKAKKTRAKTSPKMSMSKALAMSRADPWSYSSCIPDGSKSTGCFSFKENYVLGTAVGGTCCAGGFTVDPMNFEALYNNSTAGAPTFPTNWLPATAVANYSANALYKKWRPVSAGIRCVYMGSTVNDQGVIIAGLVAGGQPLSNFNGTTLQQAQALFLDYIVSPLRNGVEVLWRPEDIEDTNQFVNFGASLATATYTPSAPYMVAIVYGGNANAALLNVDYVCNYEGQYASQSFLPGGTSTPAPAESGWYETVQNALEGLANVAPVIGQTAFNVAQSPIGKALIGTLAAKAPNFVSRSGFPKLLR